MKNKNEILNELNELSPLLSALKKNENDVAVSDNYFEQMQCAVLERTKAEKKIVPLKNTKNYFAKVAVAASICFAIFFIVLNFGDNMNKNEEIISLSVSQNEIQNYIAENIDDFTAEEIGQFYAKQVSADSEAGNIHKEQPEVLKLSEEEIEYYLEDNPGYIGDLLGSELITIF